MVHAVTVLWDAIVHAALGWIVIGPFLIYALYRVFKPLLMRAAQCACPSRHAPEGLRMIEQSR